MAYSLEKGFLFLASWEEPFRKLPPETFHKLFWDLYYYQRTNTTHKPQYPYNDATADAVFPLIIGNINSRLEGQKGGTKTHSKDDPIRGSIGGSIGGSIASKDEIRQDKLRQVNLREPTFVPPTKEAVKEYAESEGLLDDSAQFVDHYSAFGWESNGKPVKDWEALYRKWVNNTISKQNRAQRQKDEPKEAQSFDTDDFFSHALERSYGKCNEPKDVQAD